MYTLYSEYPEYAVIKNCDSCGVVSTYTGTCPYCGRTLDA